MVVPLRPAKFYGRTLPRPRIYTDPKFNSQRIDPPPSVLEPLLKWANEAHWSMGGLSFKRKRMQGKIEGNLTKLRAEERKEQKKKKKEKKAEPEAGTEEEKEKENENGVSGEDGSPATATPRMEPHHVVAQPLPEEESPVFVPDSNPKPFRKRSPRVPSRARKLGDVFEQQAAQKKGIVSLHRRLDHELNVFDWVPVPDKIIHVPAKRTFPRKKDKSPPAAAAVDPVTDCQSVGSVRRSGRLSAPLA